MNIDARGRSCPEPVIMTKNALEKNPDKSIIVLVDAFVAVENIKRFAENKGYLVSTRSIDKEYKITIKK